MTRYMDPEGVKYESLQTLSKLYGDAFFVLSADIFKKNYSKFYLAFSKSYPKIDIAYSYKTNYTPYICNLANSLGAYAEVVSDMEFSLARRIGVPTKKIIFNGPVKSEKMLNVACLEGAIINIDSFEEWKIIKNIAISHPNSIIRVMIRVNFKVKGNFSRFGILTNDNALYTMIREIKGIKNIELLGLHCHYPYRDLSSYEERIDKLLEAAINIFGEDPPKVLDIGGGYMGEISDQLAASLGFTPTSYQKYADLIIGKIKKRYKGKRLPRLVLEPGTALVSNCQVFYTKIVSIKKHNKRNIATVFGSIFDISPNSRFCKLPVFPINKREKGNKNEMVYDIAGFTCIESDILTKNFKGYLDVGDFLCYTNVGAYTVVMRPPFIMPSHPILLESDGELFLIKKRQTYEGVFNEYIF